MNALVLVLNYNYEPINLCSVRRAIIFVLGGKAEVLSTTTQRLHTTAVTLACPSVIRLSHQIRRPLPSVKLSRREIFRRDNYSCQYCGIQSHDLTLDHIIPRHRGGPHSWLNLVSACRTCNHRKGGRTPEEARMRLRRPPFQPFAGPYYAIERRLRGGAVEEWRAFLPPSLYEQA